MTNCAPSFVILCIILLLSSYSAIAAGGDQDSEPSSNNAWCVVVEGFGDEKVLQSNIDYACSHQVDCGPIQPSGSCFLPDTLTSHASFAMNSYWRLNGQTPQNCDFNGSGTITSNDPSYGDCHYL